MSNLKKPKYKIYLRLLEDIRNDFRLEKFKLLKWNKLKKTLRFQSNKWDITQSKKLKNKSQLCYYKKLKFFYNHSGFFLGSKKRVISNNGILSILSFWEHKRLKKNFKYNLLNKQKLINYYNIKNYKLKNLIKKNINSKLKKYEFIKFIEKRLDNVLYKSGIVKSLYQSRQLINHKKVLINKTIQSKIDYQVNIGDLIEFINLPNFFLKNNLMENKKIKLKTFFKKKIYKKKIRIKSKFILNKYDKFILYQKNCLKQTIYKKSKKKTLKFFFLNFFPSYLEINYKTLSIFFLGNINIKKLFKFYLNLPSILNYYSSK